MPNDKKLQATRWASAWHLDARRAMLDKHPEIQSVFGPSSLTLFVILGAVGLQLTLALALREQPWWLIAGIAYVGGAFVSHGLGVLMHTTGG